MKTIFTVLLMSSILAVLIGISYSEEQSKLLDQPYFISHRVGAQHLSLDGTWDLTYLDTPITGLTELGSPREWIKAQVPEAVQWSLYRAGKLPNPYEHLNSRKYDWVIDKVWYYRRTFKGPEPGPSTYAFLCFDGIGYDAKIWLNGTLLGRHEGMFAGPMLEVGRLLKYGAENELVVEVRAGSYGVKNWDPLKPGRVILPWQLAGGHWSMIQNSGISFKEFQPIGMWQGARLELVPLVHIERPFLKTDQANGSHARLNLSVEVLANTQSGELQLHPWEHAQLGDMRDSWTSALIERPLSLKVEFKDLQDSKVAFAQTFPLKIYDGRNWAQHELEIPSAKLWWPNGMGEPNLYQVTLTLLDSRKETDRLQFDYGIRKVETVPTVGPRTQDRWANWQFVVNGRPLFVKGDNWAWPADAFMTVSHDKYSWLLNMARAEGIQLLRVWGGAEPETDDFYQLCARLGIMVWEDFPLANMDAPDWPQDIWESQVMQTVFRLRNQTSLVAWCGGNEFNPYSRANAPITGILERSLVDFDGSRPYYRTTADPGDIHTYPDMDPTWYAKLYALVPFVSETGMFSMADAQDMREVVDPQELSQPVGNIFTPDFAHNHPELLHHFLQYDFDPSHSMYSRATQMDDLSSVSFDRLTAAAQMASAEFTQIATESLQSNYPVTAGVMPWEFTVPWPIEFPLQVDGFGQPSPVYYFLKNSYEPVHIMMRIPHLIWGRGENIPMSVRVLNARVDGMKGVSASVQVLDGTFHVLWSRQKHAIELPTGPSVSPIDFEQFSIPATFEQQFFFIVAELKGSRGELISRALYWPRCVKLMDDPAFREKYRGSPQPSLQFQQGPWLRRQVEKTLTELDLQIISTEMLANGNTRIVASVRNRGNAPAFLTEVDIPGAKRSFFSNDNFFWLPPGESKHLELQVWWRDAKRPEHASLVARAWNSSNQPQAVVQP